jgi:signal transduction histidine kinase
MDTVTAVVALASLGAVGIAREVSSRRRLARVSRELAEARAQLDEQGEMANVGRLVSGLAQELKSPLQGVIGNTELMLAAQAPSPPSEELRQIRDDATRAAGLVRSLLAFTDTTALTRRWHDLNEIIARAVDACRGDLESAGVRAQMVGTERLPLVYVDGRQLERVIGTLLARPVLMPASMASGRSNITVAARRGQDRLLIDLDDLTSAGGAGEAAWAADVAACRRVLEAHGGSLEVEGRGDGGFRFHMELPVTATGADGSEIGHEEP